AKSMSNDLLYFGRMLRRAVDQHRAIFLGHGDRDLALEIEMILPPHVHGTLHSMRRLGQCLLRPASRETLGGQHGYLRRKRRTNIQYRREWLVLHSGPPPRP